MNKLLTRDGTNRREFLRTCSRNGFLGLAALLAAFSWHKARGQNCARPTPCGGCPEFADCPLPKALSLKQREGG